MTTITDIRDAATRAVACVGLAGVALVHVLDAPGKFTETPYMGWMYVGLIAACLVTAGALLRTTSTRIWLAAVALPLSALVGFVLTRTVGLPQATGDIGNWGETLGMSSLFVEGCLIALGGGVLLERAAQARVAPALSSQSHRGVASVSPARA